MLVEPKATPLVLRTFRLQLERWPVHVSNNLQCPFGILMLESDLTVDLLPAQQKQERQRAKSLGHGTR
jgi:hypothetical protein